MVLFLKYKNYNFFALIYRQADSANLVSVGRGVLLDREAAVAFNEMILAAKKNRVKLIPHSGFRSIEEQESIIGRFLKKYGPGHTYKVLKKSGESEHHTGFAIDIDDGNKLSCSLLPCYEKTSAYAWLLKNAGNFDFEISYPKNNSEGTQFEPWHWRYTGSDNAKDALGIRH